MADAVGGELAQSGVRARVFGRGDVPRRPSKGPERAPPRHRSRGPDRFRDSRGSCSSRVTRSSRSTSLKKAGCADLEAFARPARAGSRSRRRTCARESSALRGERFDAVFHLAAIVGVATCAASLRDARRQPAQHAQRARRAASRGCGLRDLRLVERELRRRRRRRPAADPDARGRRALDRRHRRSRAGPTPRARSRASPCSSPPHAKRASSRSSCASTTSTARAWARRTSCPRSSRAAGRRPIRSRSTAPSRRARSCTSPTAPRAARPARAGQGQGRRHLPHRLRPRDPHRRARRRCASTSAAATRASTASRIRRAPSCAACPT